MHAEIGYIPAVTGYTVGTDKCPLEPCCKLEEQHPSIK